MKDILVTLIALKQYIKQYHWQAKSYQEHILADKLEEGLEDYIDETAELSVVVEQTDEHLQAGKLLAEAATILPEGADSTLRQIALLLVALSDRMQDLKHKAGEMGVEDLLSRLSNSILRKIYLIHLQEH
jgi:DNA-binding ferritin-like protein